MRTQSAKSNEVHRKWYLIDASGIVVGRLASRVVSILRGKNKPMYTPHVDTGDFVVIINADKARLTGKKPEQKSYFRHTGYPGGIKMKTAKQVRQESPERILTHAVQGMLPKNRLGRRQLKKLKVYSGPEHPHNAQSPEELNLNIR